jgi:hypothetical protein
VLRILKHKDEIIEELQTKLEKVIDRKVDITYNYFFIAIAFF